MHHRVRCCSTSTDVLGSDASAPAGRGRPRSNKGMGSGWVEEGVGCGGCGSGDHIRIAGAGGGGRRHGGQKSQGTYGWEEEVGGGRGNLWRGRRGLRDSVERDYLDFTRSFFRMRGTRVIGR